MNFLSLFSGIGGFDLGLERAGMECIGQVEIDKFCLAVLKKHWPHIKRMEDIRDVKGTEFGTVDVICAGVPCQPASQAGRRKGTTDNRWLWPETFRVIREIQPTWCLLENVRGLLTLDKGMVFENLLSELEGMGYETQPFIIPACATGAPHRRDRVWVIAKSHSRRLEGSKTERWDSINVIRKNSNAPDTENTGLERRSGNERGTADARPGQGGWEKPWLEVATELCGVDDGLPAELHIIGGLNEYEVDGEKKESERNKLEWKILRTMWENREIAKTSPELYISRLYDIVPQMPRNNGSKTWMEKNKKNSELRNLWERFYAAGFSSAQNLQSELLEQIRTIERKKEVVSADGFKLTKAAHRVERLKALGNAVVPQIVEIIGRAITHAVNA